MNSRLRPVLLGAVLVAGIALLGWTYQQSLVPAIHPDHDHGLENIAGGGYLRVESVEGGRRNLVGRPGRVLILHWFRLGEPATASELPHLVDYANSVAKDDGIEVVTIAVGTPAGKVREWAQAHGVPTARLYADPEGKTAQLIGVRGTPESLIYDPDGQLAHQARGPLDWSDPGVRSAIEHFKHGAGEHTH